MPKYSHFDRINFYCWSILNTKFETFLLFFFFISVEIFTPNLPTASETTTSIKTEPTFSVSDDKTKEDEVLSENLDKLNERSVDSNDILANKEERSTGAGTSGEEQRGDSSSIGTVKRRRPRERRVPSTPFTRALGLVFSKLLCSQVHFFCTAHRDYIFLEICKNNLPIFRT